VPAAILAVAGPQAKIFNVGKRCGAKVITQTEINARMIEAAREGMEVVRLKGGDPSIFGRLAEEVDALSLAGVPFEVIPGITAGVAAAAMLGVSLTDRRKSSRIVIVSGHQAHEGEEQETPDWRGVASQNATLGHAFESLRSELLAAGLPPEMPAVIVSRATTPNQRHLSTTIGDIEKLPRVESPAILLIGWSLDRTSKGATGEASFALHDAEVLLSSLQ
jgi:siroheme synthase